MKLNLSDDPQSISEKTIEDTEKQEEENLTNLRKEEEIFRQLVRDCEGFKKILIFMKNNGDNKALNKDPLFLEKFDYYLKTIPLNKLEFIALEQGFNIKK